MHISAQLKGYLWYLSNPDKIKRSFKPADCFKTAPNQPVWAGWFTCLFAAQRTCAAALLITVCQRQEHGNAGVWIRTGRKLVLKQWRGVEAVYLHFGWRVSANVSRWLQCRMVMYIVVEYHVNKKKEKKRRRLQRRVSEVVSWVLLHLLQYSITAGTWEMGLTRYLCGYSNSCLRRDEGTI